MRNQPILKLAIVVFVMISFGGYKHTNAQAPSPTSLAVKGKILYQSNEGTGNPDKYNFYVHDLTTNTRTKLTDNQIIIWYPSIEPDGKEIAYVAGSDKYLDLYVMQVDGTNVQRITKNMNIGWVAWSPDGAHFVFRAYDELDPNKQIYTANRDGTV